MPKYLFECPKCKEVREVIQQHGSQPPMCSVCADIPMVRRYKPVNGIVNGAYDDRLGKRAWKVNNDEVTQAMILTGDVDPW